MNEMPAMPEDIQREFAAAEEGERDIPDSHNSEPEPAPEPEPHAPEDWSREVDIVIGVARAQLVGWRWPDGGLQLLHDGLCEVLDRVAPGGLKAIEKWGPYAKLAAGCVVVALANYDFGTRKFRPAVEVKNEEETHGGRGADGDRGREPAGQNTGGNHASQGRSPAPGLGPEGDLDASRPVPAGCGTG